jgi:dipeptidyl aminopeptidase/acylaminoacyl peptidase
MTVVPYSHSVRLHEALDKAKSPNKLITIKGGDHGGFSRADYVNSFKEIKDFLRQNKIIQ